MTAAVASGWSGCRVGLAPTGKRRLHDAHVKRSFGPWAARCLPLIKIALCQLPDPHPPDLCARLYGAPAGWRCSEPGRFMAKKRVIAEPR
jgi:hypothetical protein